MYQVIIQIRPLQRGNRDFLEGLIRSSRVIAGHLSGGGPIKRADVEEIRRLLSRQTAANAKATSRSILDALAGHLDALPPRPQRRQPLRTSPKRLRASYGDITLVFGPGIGLGDEITFSSFVRTLRKAYPHTPLTIFSLYPNLWRVLVPDAPARHYRSDPLRPFRHMDEKYDRLAPEHHQLVLLLDFEHFDLTTHVVANRSRRDVTEIGLGKMVVWQAPGDSPWTLWNHVHSAPVRNNYWIIRSIGEDLLPGGMARPWVPRAKGRRRLPGRRPKLLLNPLTSKPLPYEADTWRSCIEGVLARLPEDVALDVTVFPGVDADSREYAESVVASLDRLHRTQARMLLGAQGRALTGFNALPALADFLPRVDLCITLDTFTAHLAPLFAVQTVVLVFADNREFWVPSPYSYHCRLDRVEEVSTTASLLLAPERGDGSDATFVRHLSEVVVRTRAMKRNGSLSAASCLALANHLGRALSSTNASLPYLHQARDWRSRWFDLSVALTRERVPRELLLPYVLAWENTEFFKLAGLLSGQDGDRRG